MWPYLLMGFGVIGCLVAIVYACCVVAGDSDERMDRAYQRMIDDKEARYTNCDD